MPTYDYKCDSCGRPHSEWRRISEAGPACCPGCGAEFEKGFFQVFGTPTVWAFGNPTTFGQQAEINTRRLGKEKLEEMLAPQRGESVWEKHGVGRRVEVDDKIPFFRDGSIPGTKRMEKPLDLKEVKNVENYIMTGEK